MANRRLTQAQLAERREERQRRRREAAEAREHRPEPEEFNGVATRFTAGGGYRIVRKSLQT
jgi:hypothetical protein